ncbi:MAG: DapH/DapD/GlmU-related protein [Desulfovibrionales bacterium]
MTTLGIAPHVHPTAQIIETSLGSWTEVGRNTLIQESTINDYTYIMHDCHVLYSTVGKFGSIANQVRLNPGNHPMWRASQHHFTYRSARFGFAPDEETFFEWRRSFGVEIGHDVWIGHAAVVLPGVRIGTGAVIGAGAVVTRDVPPYTITGGVPARPIRKRFPENIQEKLLALAWWDWEHERIKEALEDFRTLDAETFVEKHHP